MRQRLLGTIFYQNPSEIEKIQSLFKLPKAGGSLYTGRKPRKKLREKIEIMGNQVRS